MESILTVIFCLTKSQKISMAHAGLVVLQPVLVSGLHKSLNASLWKPEHFSREFSALHSDIYNCRDGSITNTRVKEFWDGFEDVSSECPAIMFRVFFFSCPWPYVVLLRYFTRLNTMIPK